MAKGLLIKICGMKNPENILRVAELLPDYMGFIFYKESPRYVGDDFVMPVQIDGRIITTGVFVNEPVSSIIEKVSRHKLKAVQLHGDEQPADLKEIKKDTNVKIIKVFRIDDQFDFYSTAPYKSLSDYFLFDTKGKLYGGNAASFDWSKLKEYDQEVPFFLSGGLHPNHIPELLKLQSMNLFAVDFNSGVEEKPGLKNLVTVKEIFRKINLHNQLSANS